ncbi:transporter substrate-binding domain-containing protein [Pseudoalteromonas sp. SCSIO 43201]|uniref:substrate-binding periplasmic protein n=1 Tax=Pseudoalteromonas sp. SCSIO 43201 TaxID=2822842 RepID=UPI00207630CF|nr:transporter substrate-binding domain-containing protein [Pseudoalteromonas sp. SCSIO 43201]USD30400.1 transporter substrate-binding domain-containing protein [Pseudoalteromonas sp. SCSIO 43201]
MWRYPLITTIFLLATGLANAQSYSVLVYHGANPPYYFEEKGKPTGIFVDIFQELSNLTSHQFNFIPLSVARGQRYFDGGNVDIEPGVNPVWRKAARVPGIYSINYAFSTEVLLGRKANCKGKQQPEHFYGALVGKVRGYHYDTFEEHLGKDKISIYENISEKELLAQLEHNRLDYIMIGAETADYYISQQPKYRDFSPCFRISRLPVHMRFQPHLTQLNLEINTALSRMINDGKIKAIYAKYKITH